MRIKNLLRRENLRKSFYYVLGGVISYFLKLLLTILFVEYFTFSEYYAYPIAISITVIFMFWYLLKVTFKANGNLRKRIFGYISTLLFSYILDVLIMILLTSIGIDYRISLTISTGVLALIKFFIFDRVVFK